MRLITVVTFFPSNYGVVAADRAAKALISSKFDLHLVALVPPLHLAELVAPIPGSNIAIITFFPLKRVQVPSPQLRPATRRQSGPHVPKCITLFSQAS